MSSDEYTDIMEELIQEVATLRQQNQELHRLASFPQLNPNPVLEFTYAGEVIYSNPATEKLLSQVDLSDAQIFLPVDFADLVISVNNQGEKQFVREIKNR